jgi:hypothetical protein
MFVQSSVCFPETIAERRSARRRKPTRETMCRLISDSGETLGIGLLWNISVTGVSMLCNVDLAADEELEIEIFGNGSALRVGICVVHHGMLKTGDYVLGAQFDRQLDEAELRPFVHSAAV